MGRQVRDNRRVPCFNHLVIISAGGKYIGTWYI